MRRTVTRLLRPLAALPALALAVFAQPAMANALQGHTDAASMRAGDSSVRLDASSGAGASVYTDAGVPATKATSSPPAGRSPDDSTGSSGNPVNSPGSSAGSSGGSTGSPGGSIGAPEGGVPKRLEKFYKQKVSWVSYKGDAKIQCTNVKVPLDYKEPGGKATIAAMAKLPVKSGKPIGNLFANPGRPGSSGVAMVGVAR